MGNTNDFIKMEINAVYRTIFNKPGGWYIHAINQNYY